MKFAFPTLALCAVMIASCGPVKGETPMTQTVENTSGATDPVTSSLQMTSRGALPKTPPSAEVASAEARTAARLADGVSEEMFTGDVVDPSKAFHSLGSNMQADTPWRMANGKRVMFLVQRHLEKLSADQVSAFAPDLCPGGSVYSGFAAARADLQFTSAAEAMNAYAATPYGILVCEKDKDLSIKLVPSDHEIFGDDGLPHSPAKVSL